MSNVSMMHPPDAAAHSDSTSGTDETRLNARLTPKLKHVSTCPFSAHFDAQYEAKGVYEIFENYNIF